MNTLFIRLFDFIFKQKTFKNCKTLLPILVFCICYGIVSFLDESIKYDIDTSSDRFFLFCFVLPTFFFTLNNVFSLYNYMFSFIVLFFLFEVPLHLGICYGPFLRFQYSNRVHESNSICFLLLYTVIWTVPLPIAFFVRKFYFYANYIYRKFGFVKKTLMMPFILLFFFVLTYLNSFELFDSHHIYILNNEKYFEISQRLANFLAILMFFLYFAKLLIKRFSRISKKTLNFVTILICFAITFLLYLNIYLSIELYIIFHIIVYALIIINLSLITIIYLFNNL